MINTRGPDVLFGSMLRTVLKDSKDKPVYLTREQLARFYQELRGLSADTRRRLESALRGRSIKLIGDKT